MKKSIIDVIMLIDDDEATNFIHKVIINRVDRVNKCETISSSEKALMNLQNSKESELPDIIFLDL